MFILLAPTSDYAHRYGHMFDHTQICDLEWTGANLASPTQDGPALLAQCSEAGTEKAETSLEKMPVETLAMQAEWSGVEPGPLEPVEKGR